MMDHSSAPSRRPERCPEFIEGAFRWVVAGLLAVTTLCLTATAQEEETEEGRLPALFYRGMRPMGMGNAFEAVADDMNAFFYNPAGLAHFRWLQVDLVPAQGRITKDLSDETKGFSDLMDDIRALQEKQDDTEILDSPEAQRLVDKIKELRREDLKAQASVPVLTIAVGLPEAAGVRFAGGVAVSNQVLTGAALRQTGLSWGNEVLDILDDEFDFQTSLDFMNVQVSGAAEKSLGIPYLKKARAGISWKFAQRRYKRDRFTLVDLLEPKEFADEHFDTTVEDGKINSYGDIKEIIDNNTTKENGFGVDIGFQVDHTTYLSSAIVFRNIMSDIGDTKFAKSNTISVAARPIKALGMSNPFLDWVVAASLSNASGDDLHADYTNDSFTDRLHLGTEVILLPKSPVKLIGRLGNNHGYLTAGAEVVLTVLSVGIVYYGDLEADWLTAGMQLSF